MDNRTNDNRNNRDNRDHVDRHLYRLSELDDYKVASDDPDVRGWPIVDQDNHTIGKVSELVVDPDKEKVRYLDIVASGDRSSSEGERHYLIPIGIARLSDDNDNDKDNCVILQGVDQNFLNSFPEHSGDHISRDYETQVVDRFNTMDSGKRSTSTSSSGSADFYENDLYDDGNFYSNRNRSL